MLLRGLKMNDVQKNAIREANNYLKAAGLTAYSELTKAAQQAIESYDHMIYTGHSHSYAFEMSFNDLAVIEMARFLSAQAKGGE